MTDPLIYDVAVLGLGAMGSSAAYHLARRGLNVLGIDQFQPPHTWGSSHGETRVIREAYFEHPSYVPLVQRAFDLWKELEEESGEQLYLKTGGLMLGAQDSTVVRGAIQSAREHKLEHEVLDCAAIKKRFPAFHPEDRMLGVLEPRAGIMYPERCLAAYLTLAQISGAELRFNDKVTSWEEYTDHVRICTAGGEFKARQIIVSTGPWLSQLVPQLAKHLTIERQVLLWFVAKEPALFRADRFPIHLWEYEREKMFYGFPDLGAGVKIAFHHQGAATDPQAVDRTVSTMDIERMRAILDLYLPAASGDFLRGTVCLYTNTSDGHFILDRHPTSPRVLVASPCSGHGFKFASAIGEVLADLVLDNKSPLDLSLFSLDRFT